MSNENDQADVTPLRGASPSPQPDPQEEAAFGACLEAGHNLELLERRFGQSLTLLPCDAGFAVATRNQHSRWVSGPDKDAPIGPNDWIGHGPTELEAVESAKATLVRWYRGEPTTSWTATLTHTAYCGVVLLTYTDADTMASDLVGKTASGWTLTKLIEVHK